MNILQQMSEEMWTDFTTNGEKVLDQYFGSVKNLV